MSRPALAFALTAALSWSAVARGDAPVAPPVVTPAGAGQDPGIWYGWQTLIPDALSLGLLTYGYVQRDGGAAFYGGLGYLLVPPIIHLFHGRLGAAGTSLVYRLLGAPAAFIFVLQLSPLLRGVTCPTERACQNVAAGIAGAGLLGAAGVDATEAYDPRPLAPVSVPVLSGTW
jgi:hypothetical protein